MGRHCWGEGTADGIVVQEGDPFGGGMTSTGHTLMWDVAHLLVPATPTKIVCIGSNYRAHCEEMGKPIPELPKLFMKPPSALIPHEGAIELPPDAGRVDFEGELAVVIGKRLSRVSAEEVRDGVLGYTVLNDVTARDIQRFDGQFTRGKGFDTFCPVGPVVETDVSPDDLRLTTRLNGELLQDSSTADMIHKPLDLVSFISHVMTLEPGDIVSTGTPSGVAPLSPGDTIEVTIEGIGTLKNSVVSR